MKMFAQTLMVLLVLAGLLFGGCRKEQPPAPPPPDQGAADAGTPKARGEPKVQPKPKTRSEPKPLPKVEPKPKPKVEPKVEAKVQPRPLPEPRPAPASRPAVPEQRAKTEWGDARLGTMVKMRGMGGAVLTREVINVDEDTVTLKMTVDAPGAEPISQEVSMPRYASAIVLKDKLQKMGKKRGDEIIEVAGRKLRCEVWQRQAVHGERTVVARTYINRDVPGWVVKIESGPPGQVAVISELMEYKK